MGAEIDRLISEQMIARTFAQRKKLYDRAQEILAENQPMIFLASPDILAGAKNSLGIFSRLFWNLTYSGMLNSSI